MFLLNYPARTRTEIGFLDNTASRHRRHKDYGSTDNVPGYIPWRTCRIFVGRIPMDVRVQKLCVYYTDTDRGRRHREFCFAMGYERRTLTPLTALPLLCRMAIHTRHDCAYLPLV